MQKQRNYHLSRPFTQPIVQFKCSGEKEGKIEGRKGSEASHSQTTLSMPKEKGRKKRRRKERRSPLGVSASPSLRGRYEKKKKKGEGEKNFLSNHPFL